jgi:hypothetical protein
MERGPRCCTGLLFGRALARVVAKGPLRNKLLMSGLHGVGIDKTIVV